MSWRRRGVLLLAGVAVVLALFWLFVVDWLVERELERRGSEALHAIVELDLADLSAFPPGIELFGLRISNPSSPMRNALDVRRIAGRIDGPALLRGMLVVDELHVEGVRFGTPRADSGASLDADGAGASALAALGPGGLQIPSFELPKIDELLVASELASLTQIESVRSELDSLEQRWRARLESLPDEETLSGYPERIRQLLDERDPLAGAQALAELRKQLKRDVGALRRAARDLKAELAAMQLSVQEAREAPLSDLRRLRDRYGLSPEGLSNLSRRLFGEPVEQILQQAIRFSEWFAAVRAGESSGSREAGEGGALQGFLIRVARVSLEFDRGEIRGTMKNLTSDPKALGRPTTFAFESKTLPGLESLSLTGVLDHVRPEAPADSLSLRLVGYDAGGTTLSHSFDWPIRVASGRADAEVTLKLGAAGALEASARLRLHEAKLEAPFRGDSPLAALMADGVEAIRELDVRVSALGTRSDYRLEIESNADRTLSDAVGGMLRRQATRFEQELAKRIHERASGPLAELAQSEQALARVAGLIGARESLGERAMGVKPQQLKRQLEKLGLGFLR